MKKQAEFLSRGVFLWYLLLNVVCLLALGFFVNDVFAQNQPVKPKKDSKTDSLRPKVDFVSITSKNPFYNYLKDEIQHVVKVEEENIVAAPNVNIQGLIWGGRLPLAIIENRVLKVGDVINGYTIDKIEKNGVILSTNGKFFKVGPPSLTQVKNVAEIQEGGKDAK